MDQKKNISQLITQATETIREAQRPDGSFASLSTARTDDFTGALQHSTTFFASNILLALARSGNCPSDIKERTVRFLLNERSGHWSFNYWTRRGADAGSYPYPDDLDDTFVALAALAFAAPEHLTGEAFAKIVAMLTRLEIGAGGPYRTWLVRQDADPRWRDIDLAVNSTVGYFLSLNNIRLPGIERCIAEAVRTGALSSPYYPHPMHVAYFIARFYGSSRAITAAAKQELLLAIERLTEQPLDILQKAMGISAIRALEAEKQTPRYGVLVDEFMREAGAIGFPPIVFCIDPARNGARMYAGASALTAAFSIEALTGHLRTLRTSGICGASNSKEDIHDRIRSKALAESEKDGTDIFTLARKAISAATDTRITSLSYEFGTLLAKKDIPIPAPLIEELSLGNLYGWMAYTIYDDAMDNGTDPLLIPCANYFLRKLSGIYCHIARTARGSLETFGGLMDRTDDANAWELLHCRSFETLPDFSDPRRLADRSIGHAMGPLAMLLFAGYDRSSKEYASTLDLFIHYLAARQLHDDAHDWEDDLLHGRVTSAVAAIIAALPQAADRRDVPALRKIFWRASIDVIVARILRHINKARAIREGIGLLQGSGLLENDLAKLEAGARKALAERDRAVDFLNHYRPKTDYGAPA